MVGELLLVSSGCGRGIDCTTGAGDACTLGAGDVAGLVEAGDGACAGWDALGGGVDFGGCAVSCPGVFGDCLTGEVEGSNETSLAGSVDCLTGEVEGSEEISLAGSVV